MFFFHALCFLSGIEDAKHIPVKVLVSLKDLRNLWSLGEDRQVNRYLQLIMEWHLTQSWGGKGLREGLLKEVNSEQNLKGQVGVS